MFGIKMLSSALFFLLLTNPIFSAEKTKVMVVDRPNTNASNTSYRQNRTPLLPQNFIKLPVGAVKPQGWILKLLELQKEGLNGQLGEISAWLDKENNAWLGTGTDYGWEEVPYWLKGYGNMAYILNDKKMIAETKTWLDAAIQSQREDGYFGPYIEKNGKPDLWGNMIMIWCLQSYYEYSRDERVIGLMTNYFRWQLNLAEELFLKDYWENSRGGDNLISYLLVVQHYRRRLFVGASRKNTPEHGKLAPAIHAAQLAQREYSAELQGTCYLVYAVERFG